jgi:hypothetical protein
MPRAVGNQGNWFARIENAGRYPEINGRDLPCIWDHWYNSRTKKYNDPEYAPTKSKTIAVVEALQSGRFAIMRRKKPGDSQTWEAAGYVAVFEVENVRCEEALTFDVIRRVCHLD